METKEKGGKSKETEEETRRGNNEKEEGMKREEMSEGNEGTTSTFLMSRTHMHTLCPGAGCVINREDIRSIYIITSCTVPDYQPRSPLLLRPHLTDCVCVCVVDRECSCIQADITQYSCVVLMQ